MLGFSFYSTEHIGQGHYIHPHVYTHTHTHTHTHICLLYCSYYFKYACCSRASLNCAVRSIAMSNTFWRRLTVNFTWCTLVRSPCYINNGGFVFDTYRAFLGYPSGLLCLHSTIWQRRIMRIWSCGAARTRSTGSATFRARCSSHSSTCLVRGWVH